MQMVQRMLELRGQVEELEEELKRAREEEEA
jgi:hypothetical protein